MDRSALYKSKGPINKFTLSAVKRERTQLRAVQRDAIRFSCRGDLQDTLIVDNVAAPATTETKQLPLAPIELSKQQQHYKKFLDWQQQKLATKMKNGVTPFITTVPVGRLIDKAIGKAAPVHHFPKPLDFKTNEPLHKKPKILHDKPFVSAVPVGRLIDPAISTEPKAKEENLHVFEPPSSVLRRVRRTRNVTNSMNPPPTAALPQDVSKLQGFVPTVTSTLKKETSATKAPTKNAKVIKKPAPIKVDNKVAMPTHTRKRSTKAIKPEPKQPIVCPPVRRATRLKPINLATVQPSTPDIISPIYPPISSDLECQPLPSTPNAAIKSVPAEDLDTTPISSPANTSINYVSPFVTTSRGKVSHRKEQKKRDSVYTLEMNRSLDEPVEVRRNREAVAYFRNQLRQESERLLAIVSEWDGYKRERESEISSDYIDMIDVAIGQTRLLTTKKFMQFSSLIDQCESGVQVPKVLATDLEGFWSLIYIQVENCEKRFARLEQLKANKWIDPDLEPAVKPKRILRKKKMVATTKPDQNPLLSGLRQLMDRAKAEYKRRETTVIGPKSPARKSLLATVLNQEAFKVATPNIRRSSATSPKTRRLSGSPKLRRLSRSATKENTPKAVQRGILKTPGTARRQAKSVVFTNLRESLENRRKSFAATPMTSRSDKSNAGTCSPAKPRRSLQQINDNRSPDILSTPIGIKHLNFDSSRSPAGEGFARRSTRLASKKN